jgi:hypothetical protein
MKVNSRTTASVQKRCKHSTDKHSFLACSAQRLETGSKLDMPCRAYNAVTDHNIVSTL